jgi:hypothetical protein
MKKLNLNTWKSTNKETKVTTGDKVIELQEDISLFARMMVVCKSRPEINLQEAIGTHEFSIYLDQCSQQMEQCFTVQ